MVKTDKLCARCDKPVNQIRDLPIANHTNVEHPDDIHYFCSRDCKLIWLAERMEKTEESRQEVFICKYCETEWDNSRSRSQHERWCAKNPKSVVSQRKVYSIEEIREIDRLFKLTDKQIAKFVRSGRWVK